MPGKLHLAIIQEKFDEVVQLIEQKESDPNFADENDLTPIEYAFKTQYHRLISYLVGKVKIDPTCQPDLLELAAFLSWPDFKSKLGEQVSAMSPRDREIALDLSPRQHLPEGRFNQEIHIQIVKIYLKNRWISELAASYYLGSFERTHQLLSQNPDKIMERDLQGRTLFYWAALGQNSKFLYHHPAYRQLSDAQKEELQRDAVNAYYKLGNYDKWYKELLKLSVLTDDDFRMLCQYNYQRKPSEHIIYDTTMVQEQFLERAEQNFLAIKHPVEMDFYLLVKVYIAHAKLIMSENPKKAIHKFNQALKYLNAVVPKDLKDYHWLWLNIHLCLRKISENYDGPLKMTYQAMLEYAKKIPFEIFSANYKEIQEIMSTLKNVASNDSKNECLEHACVHKISTENAIDNYFRGVVPAFDKDFDAKLERNPKLEEKWQQTKEEKQNLIKKFSQLAVIEEVLPDDAKPLPEKVMQEAIQKQSHFWTDKYYEHLGLWYRECGRKLEADAIEQQNKDLFKDAIACYEKAATYHDLKAMEMLAERYSKGEMVNKDLQKALFYYQMYDMPGKCGRLLNDCLDDYIKVIKSFDLEELYILIDDYHYPIQELAERLLEFIFTALPEEKIFTVKSQYEVLFALVSRGMICPEKLSFLQPIFEEIQQAQKSTAHVLYQTVQGDKRGTSVVTDYLGIQMRGNQSLFWQAVTQSSAFHRLDTKSEINSLRVNHSVQ